MEIGRRRGIQDHSKRILENCWKLADNSNEDGVSGEGLDDEAEGWGEGAV